MDKNISVKQETLLHRMVHKHFSAKEMREIKEMALKGMSAKNMIKLIKRFVQVVKMTKRENKEPE